MNEFQKITDFENTPVQEGDHFKLIYDIPIHIRYDTERLQENLSKAITNIINSDNLQYIKSSISDLRDTFIIEFKIRSIEQETGLGWIIAVIKIITLLGSLGLGFLSLKEVRKTVQVVPTATQDLSNIFKWGGIIIIGYMAWNVISPFIKRR